MTERNALAKLAKQIIYLMSPQMDDETRLIIFSKAQRIIAELAKAHEPSFQVISSDDVIDKCRAIAEEGAKE